MNSDEIRPVPRGAILAIGDSFTAGSEVSNHESWPAQLEALMHEPVVNAGVGGWGVDQMVLRAEQLVPELRPHTLIIGIMSSDSLRNNYALYGGAYKPWFTIQNGALRLEGTPVPGPQRTSRELGYLRGVLGYSYLIWWGAVRLNALERWVDSGRGYEKVLADEVGPQVSCGLMSRLLELGRRHKMRVIVVLEYGGAESVVDTAPWYGPPVVDCARKTGLEALDTFAAFREVAKRDMEEYYGLFMMQDNNHVYGHMSAKGNGLVARLLYESFFANKPSTGSAAALHSSTAAVTR
jgi:hypothetical protein